MKKILFLVLILCSFQKYSFSQDKHAIDSFETLLKNHNARKLELGKALPSMYDTTAVNLLDKLSYEYLAIDPGRSMEYANQCLALSEQIGYKTGIGIAYYNFGLVSALKGEFTAAVEHYKKAIDIYSEIKSVQRLERTYDNIGMTYLSLGNYPEALKNFLAALKCNEETNDKYTMGYTLYNLGNVYYSLGDTSKALQYNLDALKLRKETGDKRGLALSYGYLGYIYTEQGNYDEALTAEIAAGKIFEEIGETGNLAVSYDCIGDIKTRQNLFAEAIPYHLASIKIYEQIDYKPGLIYSFNLLGIAFTKAKKYKEAAAYLARAMSLLHETGDWENAKNIHGSLAALDSLQGNYKGAWEHYKKQIAARDSLLNNENTKKITEQQMQFDFDKKESLTKVETEKELQKQKLVRNGFMGGFAVVLLFAGVFFQQRNKTKKEKQRSDELLLNILPGEVADEIKTSGTAKAKAFTMVTVMFTDFKDFTTVSEKISAELLVDEIHHCFSAFDNILHKYKIEKIKTIGDAYLCASGLPVSNHTHAVDMLNAAFEIRRFMLQRKIEKEAQGEIPFELRIGIHTGPVVAGVVGVKKYAYDIWGDTVNIAARMEQNSESGKINISGATYELVKEKFTCTHRGKIQAKNKGEIDMYFVELTT